MGSSSELRIDFHNNLIDICMYIYIYIRHEMGSRSELRIEFPNHLIDICMYIYIYTYLLVIAIVYEVNQPT